MSINYNGTRIVMNANKVPNGILNTPVTSFTGQDYNSYRWEFAIDKASVESATPSDTFNTLITFLDTAIEAKLIADFVATNTVESYGDLYDVESNLCTDQDPNTSDAYKDVVPAYICRVNVKVKIS